MKFRVQTPIQISYALKIPFNQSLGLMAGLHSDNVTKIALILRQILAPYIESLEFNAIFNRLNILHNLIKAESNRSTSDLVLSMCKGLNFSSNPENHNLKIFRSAAFEVIEFVLKKRYASTYHALNGVALPAHALNRVGIAGLSLISAVEMSEEFFLDPFRVACQKYSDELGRLDETTNNPLPTEVTISAIGRVDLL